MFKSTKKVKCISQDGRVRYIAEHIAKKTSMLREYGFEIVNEAPEVKGSPVKEAAKPETKQNSVDLSIFEGKNLKVTKELIESGKYDDHLNELLEMEESGPNRVGVKNLITERTQSKH